MSVNYNFVNEWRPDMAENPQGSVMGTGKGFSVSGAYNAGRNAPKTAASTGVPAHMKSEGGTSPKPKNQSAKHGA